MRDPTARRGRLERRRRGVAVDDQLPVAAADGPLRPVAARRQNSVRSTAGARAPRIGNRLMPSGRASAGTGAPVAARIDAVRSIVMPTCRHLAGRNSAGPADDRRHADAAFPQRPLAVEERRVARQPLAAVVVGEDHDACCWRARGVERRAGSGRRRGRRARPSRRSRRACRASLARH